MIMYNPRIHLKLKMIAIAVCNNTIAIAGLYNTMLQLNDKSAGYCFIYSSVSASRKH